MRARATGGARTTALFAFVAVVCVAALAIALTSQHVYDMQPCPWCVLQRLIFCAIFVFALLGLVWRGAAVGDLRVDRIADALARTLDREPGAGVNERRRRIAHVAGRANALLEPCELDVEAVRIECSVRLPQAHRESPALPGAQRLSRLRERGVLVKARVPAESERRRKAARRAVGIEREAKAQPARPLLRQARDDAGDDDILALEVDRQRVGEQRGRVPAADREAECKRGGGRHHGAQPSFEPWRCDGCQRPGGRERRVGAEREQRTLLQLQGDAGEPGDRQCRETPAADSR